MRSLIGLFLLITLFIFSPHYDAEAQRKSRRISVLCLHPETGEIVARRRCRGDASPLDITFFETLNPVALDGAAGPQGDAGPQGIAGPQGDVGPQGAIGPQGDAGPQGEPGPQGEVGPQGEAGPAGAVGPQGETGPQGQQGAQGATGPQGDPGPQGATGPSGVIGPQGPKGATGARGARGAQGERGPQGLQGIRGAQGEVGPQGPQGPQGVQGIPGRDAVSGYSRHHIISSGTNAIKIVDISCPAHKVVFGGGAETLDGNYSHYRIINSHPISRRIWRVIIGKFGGQANALWQVRAYALCVDDYDHSS